MENEKAEDWPKPTKGFYDEGWNAYVRGEPFESSITRSRDWRDGWNDAKESGATEPMGD